MTHVPLSSRVYYGLGSIAFGVKDNGFAYFLLIYYNQVLGLSSSLTGVALMVALVWDAISDPLVGWVSDHWHSRWGRRHPFMYFSALPLAVAYAFLWNPPSGLTEGQLFVYLTTLAVLVRTLVTLYEIPSTSLVPELTENYDERTSLLSYRYFFGWYGGLTMAALAYSVFLAATPEYPEGVLNPDGYHAYGVVGALAMFVSVLVSSGGTHRYIPELKQPPPRPRFSLGTILRQLRETLSNHNFLMIFWGSLFAFIAAGLSAAMNIYMNTFFWELTSEDILLIVLLQFGSTLLAFAIAPRVSARFDKKRSALVVFFVAIVFGPLPIILRLVDFFPANESAWLLPLLMGHGLIEVTLMVMVGIFISSMLADVAEENEIRTGRREEGLFFAARSFAQKATSGLGVLLAGVLIEVIGLQPGATPGDVEPGVIRNLGILLGPALMIFWLVALAFVARYRIDRHGHTRNLEVLARRGVATEVE